MWSASALPYWLTLHGLVTLVAVATYVITAHVLQQRRHPTAAIAWVLFILLVPYVALPAFLVFGSRKQARPRVQPLRSRPDRVVEQPWAVRLAQALGQPPPVAFDALQIHADGHEARAALWRVIDGAAQSIDLCTFILGPDTLGREAVERLRLRAVAGVTVRLLLDGLGSLMGGRPDLTPLRAAGAQVRFFVPPLHSPLKGRTNLRDHRKLLIADRASAAPRLWCGGRNLAEEYFVVDDDPGATWHDLSFDLRGPLALQAAALFDHDWSFASGRRDPGPTPSMVSRPLAPAPVASSPSASPSMASPPVASSPMASPQAAAPPLAPPPPPSPDNGATPPAARAQGAQLIASGPDQADDTVYSVLVAAAYRARSRIAIVTPYFVPDSALLLALCLAARSGVRVDLLLPARSNHRLSDVARRRALRALSDAGGHVWLAPQMLHAKLVLVDDTLALAGSANVDSRSLFLNYELMVAFHDPAAIAGFSAWHRREQASAAAYQLKRPGLATDVAEGLVLWVGFQL